VLSRRPAGIVSPRTARWQAEISPIGAGSQREIQPRPAIDIAPTLDYSTRIGPSESTPTTTNLSVGRAEAMGSTFPPQRRLENALCQPSPGRNRLRTSSPPRPCRIGIADRKCLVPAFPWPKPPSHIESATSVPDRDSRSSGTTPLRATCYTDSSDTGSPHWLRWASFWSPSSPEPGR